MPIYLADTIIRSLGNGADLQHILDEHKLTSGQLLAILRSKRAKHQLKARQHLARIHSELVAHRFSPLAVNKLCLLLGDDQKPELHLKGALAILTLFGLVAKPAISTPKSPTDLPPLETAEATAVLSAIAETFRRRENEPDSRERILEQKLLASHSSLEFCGNSAESCGNRAEFDGNRVVDQTPPNQA